MNENMLDLFLYKAVKRVSLPLKRKYTYIKRDIELAIAYATKMNFKTLISDANCNLPVKVIVKSL